jgi:hypothetical protein
MFGSPAVIAMMKEVTPSQTLFYLFLSYSMNEIRPNTANKFDIKNIAVI